jgi:hypothetical protein
MFVQKALDEVQGCIFADLYRGTIDNKGKIPKHGIFYPGNSKGGMEYAIFNFYGGKYKGYEI